MSARTLVVWDDALIGYDFGPQHPLRPLRLELTIALARELGVLDRPGVEVVAPTVADDAVLGLIHDPDYIGAVRRAPAEALAGWLQRYQLGTGDNPVFPWMHEAAALATGGSVLAAQAVWAGRAEHAINIAGGLHHAMRDQASGFCVYDDPAVAIAWLLAQGAARIAYVDIDVHHGDGVQAAFYSDPRVLTVSLHEDGRYLFPGTGFAGEVGLGDAVGTSVNVALPPGVGDSGWRGAFDAVVPPVLRAFRPQLLVTQLGCDTHVDDPLAHLQLTVAGQRAAYAALHALAHELCGGRWVAVGGGGYDPVGVVPRAWTHALAELTGAPVDGATPAGWRELAQRKSGRTAPSALSDPPAPESARGVEESVAATVAAVFGPLGVPGAPPTRLESGPTSRRRPR
ncbi:MAG: acetoin utilization protein AcuC [Mycobacteriales bacterium]